MIALGYPGEISMDTGVRVLFGGLSTIPFLYILYVLFVELTRSLDRQIPEVRVYVNRLRLLLFASWGVYPLAYLIPTVGIGGSDAWVGKQIGYSIADVVAKCVYGLFIYQVARLKSAADDASWAAQEGNAEAAVGPVAGDGDRIVAQA